jgi:hypothetical protein
VESANMDRVSGRTRSGRIRSGAHDLRGETTVAVPRFLQMPSRRDRCIVDS